MRVPMLLLSMGAHLAQEFVIFRDPPIDVSLLPNLDNSCMLYERYVLVGRLVVCMNLSFDYQKKKRKKKKRNTGNSSSPMYSLSHDSTQQILLNEVGQKSLVQRHWVRLDTTYFAEN